MDVIESFVLSESKIYSKYLRILRHSNNENFYLIDIRLKKTRLLKSGICLTLNEFEKICDMYENNQPIFLTDEERSIRAEPTKYPFIRKMILTKFLKENVNPLQSIWLTDNEMNKLVNLCPVIMDIIKNIQINNF